MLIVTLGMRRASDLCVGLSLHGICTLYIMFVVQVTEYSVFHVSHKIRRVSHNGTNLWATHMTEFSFDF